MTDFACLGDVTQDNFFFIEEANVACDLNRENCTLAIKYGEKVPVKSYGVAAGGNAANVATGLARLGLSAKLLTTFGGDERGAWLKRKLLENGVGLEEAVTDEKRESNLSAVIVFQKERTILTYHVPGEDLVKNIAETRWIYLTSSAGKDSGELHQLVLEKKGAAKLAFNPSTGDLRRGREFLQPVLNVCDVLIVNKEEAEILGEVEKSGAKIVVITDGVKGATVFGGKTRWHCNPFPSEVLETTGAGDAFSSGFLAAVFQGKELFEAMRWGMANASSVVTKLGAQEGLLTPAQMEESLLLNKNVQSTVLV